MVKQATVLQKIDRLVAGLLSNLAGLGVGFLTVVVFAQVVARYVLHVSIGGGEELPIYVMVYSVWFAAAAAARSDSHIKVDVLNLIVKGRRATAIARAVVCALTLAGSIWFTSVGWDYVRFTFGSGEVSPGLHIPLWCVAAVLPFSSLLMAVYYAVILLGRVKEAM